MSDVRFDRLVDLPLRDAWPNEASVFTPWLAGNIDHLSDAIGVPLELTGQEVPVATFSADILARNTLDGSVVLIENQLERTDHTHLGQIMTYLAGLEAQTVVWIAPDFREPHLSAIRWLNEHTADGFSFFAVKLRVVRIGDSPFAPIFEVGEKPNDWDRSLQKVSSAAMSEDAGLRIGFWDTYLVRHPALADQGLKPGRRDWVLRFPALSGRIMLTLFVADRRCGLYFNPQHGVSAETVAEILEPHMPVLSEQLGAEPGGKRGHFLRKETGAGLHDEARWPELIDWLEAERGRYLAAIAELPEGDA